MAILRFVHRGEGGARQHGAGSGRNEQAFMAISSFGAGGAVWFGVGPLAGWRRRRAAPSFVTNVPNRIKIGIIVPKKLFSILTYITREI
jgi:hypothetical protein